MTELQKILEKLENCLLSTKDDEEKELVQSYIDIVQEMIEHEIPADKTFFTSIDLIVELFNDSVA